MTSSPSVNGITRAPDVVSSPLDPRAYRAISLRNGLAVLLVTDTKSDKAAASMDVSVGSFSDPSDLPGLAHFLEHMLFLGTEKYPEEDSYNNFLAENGGYSNAFTASENTNYHFQMVVSQKNLDNETNVPGEMPNFKEALDRFSQFFTAPLFTEDATERELNAVDSEHQKNIQSDSRRIYQMKKTMANKDHPYCKFGTGSKETLGETPAKEGIDTRARLLEFYKTYYSANLMKMCVCGPYDLDTLEAWVVELFSEIPNSDRDLPCEAYRGLQPLSTEHKGLIFNVETIKDIRQLEVCWITPPFWSEYRSKPMWYVTNLLGDEGVGSFLSLLKKRGWCDSVEVGPSDQMTYSSLQLTATLTSEGVQYVDEILSLLYQYLQMVKETGIQEWLFKEEQTLSQNTFRFMERHEPVSFVTRTSSAMHKYPPEEYLSGHYLIKEYNPKKIREVLSFLTPENGNVVIAGKFTGEKTTMKERWYNTPYHVEKIDKNKLERWSSAEVISDFHIPAPNPFVPTDFDLVEEPLSSGKDQEGPRKIHEDKFCEIHHKVDRTFGKPKAVVFMHMSSPVVYHSPFHVVISNLLTSLLEDELTEYSYPAEKAGFDYRLDQMTTGIRLFIRGYSHRIDVLLNAIMQKIATYTVDPIRFEMQKDALERNYANFRKSQPYALAMYNSTQLLEDPRWHIDDYLSRMKDGSVTMDAVSSFLKSFRERLYVTALINGNINDTQAVSMVQSVQSITSYSPLPDAERLMRRVVQIPVKLDVFVRQQHTNLDDNNSAIEVFYQTGPAGRLTHDVTLDLLGEILKKPAFHELRTVQQLGYIVFEGVVETFGKRGIYLIVQSTVADPDILLDRIDSFLTTARSTILAEITEETFDKYVSSLVTSKAEPDTNLLTQTFRYWREIDNEHFMFDRKLREIEALQHVTKEDVIEFFDTFLAPGGSKYRRVVSQVYGSQHPLEERRALQENAIEVSNAVKFRRQNPLYPVNGVHPIM